MPSGDGGGTGMSRPLVICRRMWKPRNTACSFMTADSICDGTPVFVLAVRRWAAPIPAFTILDRRGGPWLSSPEDAPAMGGGGGGGGSSAGSTAALARRCPTRRRGSSELSGGGGGGTPVRLRFGCDRGAMRRRGREEKPSPAGAFLPREALSAALARKFDKSSRARNPRKWHWMVITASQIFCGMPGAAGWSMRVEPTLLASDALRLRRRRVGG